MNPIYRQERGKKEANGKRTVKERTFITNNVAKMFKMSRIFYTNMHCLVTVGDRMQRISDQET